MDTAYTDRVEIMVLVPESDENALRKDIMEGTNGQAGVEKMEECWFDV